MNTTRLFIIFIVIFSISSQGTNSAMMKKRDMCRMDCNELCHMQGKSLGTCTHSAKTCKCSSTVGT